jgi:hypothetical protein
MDAGRGSAIGEFNVAAMIVVAIGFPSFCAIAG